MCFGDTFMVLVLQVKLLLTHHADPTICNKELKTPLDLACEFGRYRVRRSSVVSLAWSLRVRDNLYALQPISEIVIQTVSCLVESVIKPP